MKKIMIALMLMVGSFMQWHVWAQAPGPQAPGGPKGPNSIAGPNSLQPHGPTPPNEPLTQPTHPTTSQPAPGAAPHDANPLGNGNGNNGSFNQGNPAYDKNSDIQQGTIPR